MSRSRDTRIFVHVPKTGGTTTIYAVLTAAFPEDERIFVPGTRAENGPALEAVKRLAAEARRRIRIVAGHNTFGLAEHFENAGCFTILREPLAHLRSLYFHERSRDGVETSPEDFERFLVSGRPQTVGTRFPNPQTSSLAGEGVDPEALLDRFDALGLTEELDEFFVSLHVRWGFPLVLFHDRMVGTVESRRFVPSRRAAEIVAERHAGDVALHRLAVERVRAEREAIFGPRERALLADYREALARFRAAPIGNPYHTELFDPIGAARRAPARIGPPLVSIVTPTRNGAEFLERCIRSVLAQTHPRVEHVVQDGASTDGSLEILERYRDRIDFVSEPDAGESDALDRALRRCRGDVILVLNSDDMLLPHAAAWGVEQLDRHPDVAVVYGDQYLVNRHDEIVGAVVGPDPWSYEKILCVEQVPPAQAAFIRRAHLHSVGLRADRTLGTCPDHEMWVRIGARHPMLHVPGFVVKYRLHANGTGRQRRNIDRMVRDKERVNERVLRDPKSPPEIRALERRARASLRLWASSMCIDSGDPIGAAAYALRGLAIRPSSDNLAWAARGVLHWLRVRSVRRWWSDA